MNNATHTEGISVQFIGESQVEFTKPITVTYKDSEGNDKFETEQKVYAASHNYFQENIWLIGKDTLHVIDYAFPFQFTVPPSIPSSFKGKFGSIEYYIKAVLHQPMNNKTTSPRAKVNIVDKIDCGLQKYNVPRCYSDEKYVGCLWCKDGPISMDACLKRSAYVRGESIHRRYFYKQIKTNSYSKSGLGATNYL